MELTRFTAQKARNHNDFEANIDNGHAIISDQRLWRELVPCGRTEEEVLKAPA